MIDFIFSFITEGLIQNGLDSIFDSLVPAIRPYRRAIYVLYMVITSMGLLGIACVAPIIVLALLA